MEGKSCGRVRRGRRAGQKIVIAPPKTLDDALAGEGVLSRTRPHSPCWGLCHLCTGSTLACHLSSEVQDFQTVSLQGYLLCIPSLEAIWILGHCQKAIGPSYLKTSGWYPLAKLLPSPLGYLHLGPQDRAAIFLYKGVGCPKTPSCVMHPGHTRPPTFS